MSPTRTLRLAGLLLVVVSASACSLFGIATKGDLESQSQLARRQFDSLSGQGRELRAQIAAVETELERVRTLAREQSQQIRSVIERAERDRADLRSQTGELQLRLTGMEGGVIAARDAATGLGEQMTGVSASLDLVDADVEALRGDLGDVAGEAENARLRSEQLLRAWTERLRGERQRLLEELRELDDQLRTWERAVELDVPQGEQTPRRPGAGAPPVSDPELR